MEVKKDINDSLHSAVLQQKVRLTRILLEGGTDPNTTFYDGKSPLMVACSTRYDNEDDRTSIVLQLLKHKADTNIQDVRGRTALMYAVRYAVAPRIVKLLLENGADRYIGDQNGNKAFRYIRSKYLSQYIQFFRPDFEQVDKNTNHRSHAEEMQKTHNWLLPDSFKGRLRISSYETTAGRTAMNTMGARRSESEDCDVSLEDLPAVDNRRHSECAILQNCTYALPSPFKERKLGAEALRSDQTLCKGSRDAHRDTTKKRSPKLLSKVISYTANVSKDNYDNAGHQFYPETMRQRKNKNKFISADSVSTIDMSVLTLESVPVPPKLPPIGSITR